MQVSVSFLKSNNTYQETIRKINQTSADFLHVDIMDGVFVPDKNFAPEDLDILDESTKPLDVHLMVSKPLDYLKKLTKYQPTYVTIHYEIDNKEELINEIKTFSKVGISIKPETKVREIIPYLNKIDLVLVMGVNPGRGGQEMLSSTIAKLNELKNLQKDSSFVISVDGGVNDQNIKLLKENIDIAVSGSFITMEDNYEEMINKLR